MKKDEVLQFQVEMTHAMMERWGMGVEEFIEFDGRHNILRALAGGYTYYRDMMDDAVIDIVEKHLERAGVCYR